MKLVIANIAIGKDALEANSGGDQNTAVMVIVL